MRNILIDGQIGTLFRLLLRKDITPRKATLVSGQLFIFLCLLLYGDLATDFGYTIDRVAAAVNSSAWSLGSSNLANGLTAGEAIGMVFIGSFIAGLIAFLCGEPGVSD